MFLLQGSLSPRGIPWRSPEYPVRGLGRGGLLQRLEAYALGLGPFFAEAFLLVGFVFLVVAREEGPLRFAFAGEDVRGYASA
jgi:hypothetical protein